MRLPAVSACVFAALLMLPSPAKADLVLRQATRRMEGIPFDWRPGDRLERVDTATGATLTLSNEAVFRRVEFDLLPRGPITVSGRRGAAAMRWALYEAGAEFAFEENDSPAPSGPDEIAAARLQAAREALSALDFERGLHVAQAGLAAAQSPVLRAQLLEARAGAEMYGALSDSKARLSAAAYARIDAKLSEAQALLEAGAPGSVALANLRFRRSQAAESSGRSAEARVHIDAAVALLRAQPGPSLALANALFLQSVAMDRQDDEATALRSTREMADIADHLGASAFDRVRFQSMLSSDERLAGHIERAEIAARAAVVAIDGSVPPSIQGGAWLALGQAELSRGRTGDAQRSFTHANQLLSRARGDPNAANGKALVLQHLGSLARARGDLPEARRLFLEMLELRRRLQPNGIDVARALQLLGAVEADRGDADAAAALYEEADAIERKLGVEGRTHAVTRLKLGDLWLAAGQYERAAQAFAQAERFLAQLTPDNPLQVAVLRQQAALAAATGHHREALGRLDRALAIASNYARSGPEIAGLNQMRGAELIELGQFDAAIDALQQARAWQAAEARGSAGFARTEFLLGQLQERRGRHAAARSKFCAAADLVDRIRVPLSADSYAQAQFRAQFGEIYRACLAAAYDAGEVVEALRVLDRFRGRGFVTALQSRELEGGAARELRRQVPEPLSSDAMRAAVPADTTLLAYAVLPRRTLLFRITRAAIDSFELPVAAADLQRDVAELRERVARRDPADLARLQAQGEALYARLVAPAAARGALWIAPDGPLHDLPFAALRDPGAGWLGETTAITLIDSLSIEAAMRRPHAASRGFVGVADALTAQDMPALPAARDEIASAAEGFDIPALLVGAEASKARVLELAPHAAVLHLAVHATVDALRPLDSAIELSPSPGDDGRLHLWEVLERLRLRARLVVLSGCDTAQGRHFTGEGLFGFARAFRFAGAQRVIASLWPIQDRPTATLMEAFYAARRADVDDAEALRQAIAQTLRTKAAPAGTARGVGAIRPRGQPSVADTLAHPYYWAAFQLYGTAWQSAGP